MKVIKATIAATAFSAVGGCNTATSESDQSQQLPRYTQNCAALAGSTGAAVDLLRDGNDLESILLFTRNKLERADLDLTGAHVELIGDGAKKAVELGTPSDLVLDITYEECLKSGMFR
jgi:hypothetical protein